MRQAATVRSVGALLFAAVIAPLSGCTPPAARVSDPETEKVPVAYGAQQRENLTGSVASVAISEEHPEHYQSVLEMLGGRVPGVQVTRTARGVSVRIRGTNTLGANAEPLFVVDGVAMMPSAGGGILGVSPHDVARIEVLKDAAAAALYGVRGANGVVVITTKRAR